VIKPKNVNKTVPVFCIATGRQMVYLPLVICKSPGVSLTYALADDPIDVMVSLLSYPTVKVKNAVLK
jgi:hypothetical protein